MREGIMRLRGAWLVGGAATLLLCASGGAARATSTSIDLDLVSPDQVYVSGNGLLEFSDFRVQGLGCHGVDPSDLELEILEDGVAIAGNLRVDGRGPDAFFVSYRVTALGPPIDGASLALDTFVDGDQHPTVFATKRLIGDFPEKPSGHPGNHHGWGHHGWGLLPGAGSSQHHDRDDPSQHQGGNKTLAFLKAAVWEPGGGCLPHWRWVCEGDFDEASFAPHDTIKVIDGLRLETRRHAGITTFVSSTNRFSVVPEPDTAALLVLGLSGLAFAGRRRS
jgi:hypothetical protein